MGRPLHPPSWTMEAAQRWVYAVLLRAPNTLPHIASALGVGRTFILKVIKLLKSGQGLTLPKRCERKRSVRSGRRIGAISAAIERNLRKSVCALARSNNAERDPGQHCARGPGPAQLWGVSNAAFGA